MKQKNRSANKNEDPREILYTKLLGKGIDVHHSMMISLDAGIGLVNKEYLISLNLSYKQLKASIQLVKNFYFSDYEYS